MVGFMILPPYLVASIPLEQDSTEEKGEGHESVEITENA